MQGDGDYEVITDFEIDDWLRQKIKATEDKLLICMWCCTQHLRSVLSVHVHMQGDGDYEVITDFEIDDWLRQKIKATEDKLLTCMWC
jgi:hypothetical protein